MKKKIYVGASYYPEQWPKERWPIDLQLMQEAGINVLRVAELAWSVMEPEEGEFDFEWLHDFIALAHEAGMDIVIGTPTETSPKWLLHRYPEIVASDETGHIHGQRGGHCYSSKVFEQYVEKLVTAMAREFAHEPGVIGWQIDNELKGIKCTCKECNAGFRKFLKKQYGTLEKLNEDCGTIFWSQTYRSFEEVSLPANEQLTIPVSMYLEQSRFASYLTVKHCERQADIIKKYAPDHFVTHNTLGLYPWLNVYDLSRTLDFISWDTYPQVDGDNYDVCMCHDLHRGAKRDNYWIMEQKNGYLNYSPYNLAIEPGLVRFWGFQDIARGAGGVLFYRWRSGKFSVEQNPNGILRHDGSPRRAYYEVKQMIQELSPFQEDLYHTKVEAQAAIIYSYDQQWAVEAHKQYPGMDYVDFMLSYYKALSKLGVTVDLVEPMADLSSYKVVIAPSMMMLTDELAEHLNCYARDGGNLLLTLRSGIKNWSNTTTELAWPGQLAEAAGITVEEFEVFPEGSGNAVSYKGKEYPVKGWVDMLTLHTALPLAVYLDKFYKGLPAISCNSYGKGCLYYVGVMGNEELFEALLSDICKDAGVKLHPMANGVFLTKRRSNQSGYAFYLNANHFPVEVDVEEAGEDLISGVYKTGKTTVDSLGVMIIKVK